MYTPWWSATTPRPYSLNNKKKQTWEKSTFTLKSLYLPCHQTAETSQRADLLPLGKPGTSRMFQSSLNTELNTDKEILWQDNHLKTWVFRCSKRNNFLTIQGYLQKLRHRLKYLRFPICMPRLSPSSASDSVFMQICPSEATGNNSTTCIAATCVGGPTWVSSSWLHPNKDWLLQALSVWSNRWELALCLSLTQPWNY